MLTLLNFYQMQLSWFPFFLFDTDWMGREVFQGDPLGNKDKAIAYDVGVHQGAFGLLLNSVRKYNVSVLYWCTAFQLPFIFWRFGNFLLTGCPCSRFIHDPLCRRVGAKLVWSISNFMICICMASTAVISALAITKDDQQVYMNDYWAKNAAIAVFAILGLPLAVISLAQWILSPWKICYLSGALNNLGISRGYWIMFLQVTYSVPYSITAELTSGSGGGQGVF